MDIILPIKHQFVQEILNGNKTFEYRKKKPLQKIEKIIFYVTTPINKCVCSATIKNIIEEPPVKLWEMTKDKSGITIEEFKNYYKNKEMGVAFELTNIIEFKRHFCLKEIGVNFVPQNFIYLDYKKDSKYICY